VGCNASGISQTLLKAQNHSVAKKVHCSRLRFVSFLINENDDDDDDDDDLG